MKKYILSALTIFLAVTNFVLCWYSDTLFNHLFIFYAFAHGILLLIMIVCIIICIIMSIHKHNKLQNLIAIVVAIVSVVLTFVFPFRTVRTDFEFRLYADERADIVEMVKNNELEIDKNGNASLPDGYKKVSSDGNIFIYRNDDEQVIAFWIFRGMLSGSVLLVYSSQDEKLIYDCETAHPIIEVVKMSDHWYYVQTDY